MNTYGHKFDELVSDNNETMAKAENSYNAGTYTRSVDSGGKYSVEINNISRQISD